MSRPAPAPTWLWWSSGKDSAWALHVLRSDPSVRVTGLLTTVHAGPRRAAVHDTPFSVVRAQAREARLPLHVFEVPPFPANAVYEEALAPVLVRARGAAVEAMAFGDLHLEDVRAYREGLLEGSGISPRFPLWGRDTAELARAMVRAGLEARVVCVDTEQLDGAYAGAAFDEAFLESLPDIVDPCGEAGEFHTCVTRLVGSRHALPVRAEPGRQAGRFARVRVHLEPTPPERRP